MIDLVAAAVSGEQRALISRKPRHCERRIGRRRRQRLLAFARGRQCVQVVDAGLIRADEQLLVVGRPRVARRHDVRGGGEERFRIVLRRRGRVRRGCGRSRLGCRLRARAAASERQRGNQCTQGQRCRVDLHELPILLMSLSYAILVAGGCLRDHGLRWSRQRHCIAGRFRSSITGATPARATLHFPEHHQAFSLSYVRHGTFGYRVRGREFEMVAGAMLIGFPGDEFLCTHEHACGDECLSFRLSPGSRGHRRQR